VEIKESLQFVRTLRSLYDDSKIKDSSKGKVYIIQKEDGSFAEGKRSDRLSTQRIAKIAQDCLKTLVETPNVVNSEGTEVFGLAHRMKVLETFKNSIEQHNARIYKSKPWWAKVMSFFGVKSAPENQLSACAKKISNHLASYNQRKDLTQNQLEGITLARLKTNAFALKDFYQKVLDSTNFKFPIEGMRHKDACLSFINQLKDYKVYLEGSGRVGEAGLIDRVQKDLKAAYDLEVFYQSADWWDNPANVDKKISSVLQQIKDLAADSGSSKEISSGGSHQVLILGGSQDHGVVYQIKKEENETYSFNIINTGVGSKYDGLRGWLNGSVKDVKYTGIRGEDLTPDFIKSLVTHDDYKNIDEVLTVIDRHFSEKKNVVKGWGRIHNEQQHGTCASKSIASWLKGELPLKIGREFKFLMTEKKINALKELKKPEKKGENFEKMAESKDFKNRLSKSKLEILTDAMITEGEKVLAKRKQKAKEAGMVLEPQG